MKKKRVLVAKFISMIIVIATMSNIAYADEYDKIGWINEGKPKYTWATLNSNGTLKDYPSYLKKNDVSGSTIMSRLRSSYTLKNRASQITNRTYMQTKLYRRLVDGNSADFDYSNITYYDSPFGAGYTKWYDSNYGIFLDYVTQFSPEFDGRVVDSNKNVDIVQDSIDFAKTQYGATNSAYLATTQRSLGDARVASICIRDGSNYPIYLNSGRTVDDKTKSALKSKGVKNIYVLGGSTVFDYTAGLTSGFNIIRAGGRTREDTKELMLKLPKKIKEPQHYEGDSEGLVMSGVPKGYESVIKSYLKEEKRVKDGTNLVKATKLLNDRNITVGSEPNQSSLPSLVVGINDGTYEAYWICYWNANDNGYVYQFVLGGYYDKVEINSDITSIDTSNTVYKENSTTYWTKTNSDVNIYTRGTTNVKYDMNSVGLSLYNNEYGNVDNSPKHTLTPTQISTTSNFNTSFTNSTINKAVLGTYNGLRSITGKHIIKAKEDNKIYNLYSSAHLGFWSTPKNSNLILKTDGTAPIGDVDYTLNSETCEAKFTVKNIVEKGSGVKKIWVEYIDEKNPNIVKEEVLIKNGENYTGCKKVSDIFSNVENIKVKVRAIDNVGNESVIFEEKSSLLKIEATITRVLSPHEPTFREGEKGILEIKLYGEMDKVKITFPTELSKLNSSLNTEMSLIPQPTRTIKYEFFIPIGTENKDYNVQVIGYKGTTEKKVYPTFNVIGSILESLRTRIRS